MSFSDKPPFRVVLFLADFRPTKTGYCRTIARILDHLEEQQIPFLALSPSLEGEWPYRFGQFLKLPSVPFFLERDYRLVLPLQHRRIFAHVDAFQPTLVHISNPCFSAQFGLKYARARKLPVVSTYHTHYVRYGTYYHIDFLKPLAMVALRNIYKQCELVLVPTPTIMKEVRAFPVHVPMKLWGRGVDLDVFHPKAASDAWRRSLGGGDGPIALFAGRLVKEKAPRVLAAAYREVRKTHPHIRWVVAGSGALEKKYRRLLPDAHFTGHLAHDRLRTIYASSDFFVYPSDTDTFANVALEAMASGLPLIVANSGGPGDLVKMAYGNDTTLFPPGDAHVFAEKIRFLADTPDHAKKLGALSRTFAESQRWDLLLEQLMEHFEAVACPASKLVPAISPSEETFAREARQ